MQGLISESIRVDLSPVMGNCGEIVDLAQCASTADDMQVLGGQPDRVDPEQRFVMIRLALSKRVMQVEAIEEPNRARAHRHGGQNKTPQVATCGGPAESDTEAVMSPGELRES